MKKEMVAKVDLSEEAFYIVKDGNITKVSPKEHGQDVVIWKNGKVLDVDRSERIRLNGQEVI
ncbi:DUF3954 domain-containing protein [Psychrobacillus sp. FSL K6-1464]|uniref:DUF3954 domain-containing protein n=1 Tax=Psychrobacillus sp. FSL K6-1464 TaxID=2921545 RepID=UPI0030FC07BA